MPSSQNVFCEVEGHVQIISLQSLSVTCFKAKNGVILSYSLAFLCPCNAFLRRRRCHGKEPVAALAKLVRKCLLGVGFSTWNNGFSSFFQHFSLFSNILWAKCELTQKRWFGLKISDWILGPLKNHKNLKPLKKPFCSFFKILRGTQP